MEPLTTFKKKFAIRLSVALGLIVTLIVLLVLINRDANRRVERISALRTELNSRSQAIGLLAQLKKDAEQAKPLLTVLENRLPSRDDLILFPRELEKLAKDSQVDFGFSFGNENLDADTPSIAFTMSLSGVYANLVNFFKAIEASRYYIHLNNLDLTRKEGGQYGLVTTGEVFVRVNGETQL